MFSFTDLSPVTLPSPSTALKRYPDTLSCQKYYIQLSATAFTLHTCSNRSVFNPIIEQCGRIEDYTVCFIGNRPKVRSLGLEEKCKNARGYYCSSNYAFTYSTRDNVKIVENECCPGDEVCQKSDRHYNPCAK
jgi:hypothetical protein